MGAQNTYNETMIKSYNSRLSRIQELQRLVGDEIGQFENKRKNESLKTENDVETTKTHIVSNVKGVEFKSCIAIHQQLNEEYENEEESFSDDESVSSTTESINSVIFKSSDRLQNDNEQNDQIDSFSSTSTSDL